MLTIVRLTRNGNSTTLCIPKPAIDHLGWLPGEHIAIAINDDKTITAVRVNVRDLIRASNLPPDQPTAAAPAV